MKVLLISNNFPNSVESVRGIFAYHIAKSLQKKCDLEVIAPLPWIPKAAVNRFSSKHPFAAVPYEEDINGIKVYHPRYLVIPKILGFMHGIFMFFPLLRLIKRLEHTKKIDVLNAHWVFPDGVATAWVGRRLKKPTVLTGMGCDLNYYPSLPFRKKLIVDALNMANMITVKGKELEQKVMELGFPEGKISVIPNGLDFGEFSIISRKQARQKLQLEHEGPIVLSVASLDEAKGGRYLVEAMKWVDGQMEGNPKLIMVGDGPLKDMLMQQAMDLGIEKRVLFMGKRPHEEIALWMNAADLFCLSSIREGRPNVLLEAIACGTPVVASNVGSIPEMIQTANGRIAKAADSKILARQILDCLGRTWDRKAIRNSIAGFTWEDSAELYMQTYLRAMGRGKSA